ncbi:MAG: ATP-binding protein [Thermodesulfobacteriota bacterium]
MDLSALARIGMVPGVAAISLVAVAVSPLLYLLLTRLTGDFQTAGLVRAVIIPSCVAPFLSYFVLTLLRRTEEARSRYQGLVETMQDGVLHLGADGLILTANPAWEALTGHRPQDVVGRPLDALVPEGERQRVERGLQVLRDGRASTDLHLRLPHRAGGEILAELRLSRQGRSGVLDRVVAVVRDITERQRLEGELRQARQLEAVGRLAAGVAHDFNNILNIIEGHVRLSLLEAEAAGPLRESLDGIAQAGSRAAAVVRQLLAYSRQPTGERVPVRLQDLLAETLRGVSGALPPGITLHQELDQACGPVLGDPAGLQQVVLNLVTNAQQAMAGGGTLEVRLDRAELPAAAEVPLSLPAGTYLRLTVTDTGSGMDEATRQRIFEPYFTTKALGKGTGLGLAMAHGVVLAHGGGVQVHSRPGQGSRFLVFLPEENAPGRLPASQQEGEGEPMPAKGIRVLYVDDEEMSLSVWRMTLQRLGFEVTACFRADQALERLQEMPDGFDVVLTDQRMPIMTGLELCQAIHAIRPHLPVLLATGWNDLASAEEALAQGVWKVIPKPHQLDDLVSALLEAAGSPLRS